MRTLVIDTATAACSVALFEGDTVTAARHDVVGRGHAERLVPMIAELPEGGRADRILVDVGPGSFTGVRVGLAAALGLGLGWSASVEGYSSMALIAAGAFARDATLAALVVAIQGGHGEVFLQSFAAASFAQTDALSSRLPAAALDMLAGRPAIGSGWRWLAQVDPDVAGAEALPVAAEALLLPSAFRTLPARPIYGRAPDAKIPA